MSDPIRIHHADSDDEVQARHARAVKRLEELGPVTVRAMYAAGELPNLWTPIIMDWLKDR